MEQLLSLLGIIGLVAFGWLISNNRSGVRWRPIFWGVSLQLAFAALILLPDVGKDVFSAIDIGVKKLISFSDAGSDFVFGTIQPHEIITIAQDGSRVPLAVTGGVSPPMRSLAFWVLPTVIFFSAIMAVLYHYGVMQKLVGVFARGMHKTLGTSGAESLSAAANIFVGQTEAPLVVRPFVNKMTNSELHAIMVGGFATVAGGVMAIYVAMLGDDVPGIAGHLVTASILSAPAALAIAKLMYPEDGVPATLGKIEFDPEKPDINGIDALSRGTLEGLKLFLNIIAMLLVFYAVVTMFNALLGAIGGLFDIELSLQLILSYAFAPFALLMGVPWDEALQVGMYLGEKMTLTELIAFGHFAELQGAAETALSDRSAIITSYALCGFANFASIGIQIGGIGGLAPERRGDLARLGFRAMIGGTLAAMMTGAVAGLFLG